MAFDEANVVGMILIDIVIGDAVKRERERIIPAQVDHRTWFDCCGATPEAASDAWDFEQIRETLFKRSAIGGILIFFLQPEIDMVFHARTGTRSGRLVQRKVCR